MKEYLLKETLHQIAMDCIELIEANEEQDVDGLQEYCRMYLLFIDKRYQVLHEVKKESIRTLGLPLKSYYESMMKEMEKLMGILLREETEEILSQSNLLLSFCHQVLNKFMGIEKIQFEKNCPETPEIMEQTIKSYIEERFSHKWFGETSHKQKNVELIPMHR